MISHRFLDVVIELKLPQIIDFPQNLFESVFVIHQSAMNGRLLNYTMSVPSPRIFILPDFELGQIELMEVVHSTMHCVHELRLFIPQGFTSLCSFLLLHELSNKVNI